MSNKHDIDKKINFSGRCFKINRKLFNKTTAKDLQESDELEIKKMYLNLDTVAKTGKNPIMKFEDELIHKIQYHHLFGKRDVESIYPMPARKHRDFHDAVKYKKFGRGLWVDLIRSIES